MQNKNKIRLKIDQIRPLTSCHFKNKHFWKQATWPSLRCLFGPYMGHFGPSAGSLGLLFLSTHCHLTSCKKSEKSSEWIFRYMDFFVWSVNYWSVFCTYFEDKYLRNQKFLDNGFL